MPQGFEVYGPDGSAWVSVTDYIGKLKGSVTYVPGSSDPNPVRVDAPGAAALTDPFCVVTGNIIQNDVANPSSGGSSMTFHTFPCSNAAVVSGQNKIDIYGSWAYLVNRNVTLWYGSR